MTNRKPVLFGTLLICLNVDFALRSGQRSAQNQHSSESTG
ncbi:hypothetical protein CES85_5753 [Ochrobactrum quorumnocens]|uniref:Uncharacterized protein n=1 Tax=Ochrobactrum quorumnocens TaxID=271865 RepID=A0A248UF49_9HYPH|nr:hypothetical protein CES85_4765 [[Ochrobactrum] quorumnocens]ASV84949.1 hypothetical protein CES85_5753 [[Ochrobactrum] quorumnocens]